MRWPVGLFLLMSVFSGVALAQSDPDWKICNADDHDAAIAACTRLIGNGKLSKKNLAIAYLNRGVSYERNGEYDKAIADATFNIETDPREAAEGYFNRGFAYKKKGEIEKALNDYNTAIKLKPTYIDPHTNRGVIFVQRGEYDRAIADHTKTIEIDPKYSKGYNNRGDAYRGKGDFDRAITEYSKAIELEPKNAFYIADRGYIRFHKGDFGSAAEDLRQALALKDYAYAMLFRYLARARAGETAGPELEANAGRLSNKNWPYAAIELLLGKRTPEATLPDAADNDEKCEAHFYIGEWHLLRGNRTSAAGWLKLAQDTCPKGTTEYYAAVAEFKRLQP